MAPFGFFVIATAFALYMAYELVQSLIVKDGSHWLAFLAMLGGIAIAIIAFHIFKHNLGDFPTEPIHRVCASRCLV